MKGNTDISEVLYSEDSREHILGILVQHQDLPDGRTTGGGNLQRSDTISGCLRDTIRGLERVVKVE